MLFVVAACVPAPLVATIKLIGGLDYPEAILDLVGRLIERQSSWHNDQH
jgi:hypothetical protein